MKPKANRLLEFLKKHKYGKISLALILLVMVFSAAMLIRSSQEEKPIALSKVAAAISAGQVVKVEDSPSTGLLTISYTDGSEHKAKRDTTSSFLEQMRYLGVTNSQLARLDYEIADSGGLTLEKIASFLISFGMLGLAGFVMIRMTGGGLLGSRKKYAEGDVPSTRFNDVAGVDESREELADIVTFLKDSSHYERLGARMPRGVLLVGDPGTGKTLLARAVAGEAGVPFFSTSGSEFVEVFVGMGASRVRALFKKAREKAPCIVFIDEIDAVGRKRHSTGGGGEMEQDQTLNQLLVEMDGFAGTTGVVVLAATNRTDVLDPALTRPGRFDRHVNISRPDVNGRRAILEVHVKDRRLAPDVDLTNVAKSTPGLVGADLANIVNEAAIQAVRGQHEAITVQDFQEAVEKALTGGTVQQKNRVISQTERRTIAYHEAGHAVVMHATPHSDPVYKVTIIPRGQMGGFTMSLPEQESMLMSRNQFMARITGLMGGRVAEEIFCGDITSGAANDLKVATQLAEEMVMRLGMSGTGLRVFNRPEGYEALSTPRSGQKTYEALDKAITQILEDGYQQARQILTDKKDFVERVTASLLDQETLSREQFEALA